ncbi:MAG: hypothetical protein NTV91_09000 [Proteobacteria bacterium]|nr:hypothetical protein [Pseudomonadota bacterium]
MRAGVFSTLFDVDGKSRLAKQVDSFITWLIIANLVALVIEHIPTLYATHEASFGLFDRISIYIFTLEYLLRLFAAGGDPRYQGKRFAGLRFAVTPFALPISSSSLRTGCICLGFSIWISGRFGCCVCSVS